MTKFTQLPSAADRAYEDILRWISDQTLTAGEQLPEASLASRLGVSRTPVREAIRRLEQEGIVILVAGGGARVATPSLKEMTDAMEVRAYLERMAIRKVAPVISPLQLCRLEEAIHEQDASGGDIPFLFRKDSRFHHLLAETTGNDALVDSIDLILTRSTAFRILFAGKDDGDNRLVVREHTAILEALRSHDADLAEKRLMDHLEMATTGLVHSMSPSRHEEAL